ncbi:MAG TPA: MarR family transcriptional regulator [Candidatus Saccharimonadales bacterium]|nr:MarR family transcriptional regulator [Candidatus Saccharimonadales bacterium]
MDTAPQDLHKLLQHIATIHARESDQILLEQFGIGYSQYKILGSIKNNPALRQKHIAFELGQTEASVSRQINLLQERGMLTVRVNPTNRREHSVVITRKAERLMEAAEQVLANYQSASLSHLSKQQQNQLLNLLATIFK